MHHLSHDELFQVHIITQGHSACMDAKNSAFGLGVRERKLDLPVYPARSDQGRVQ